MTNTANVKMVGIVLEIDEKEVVVGPEQCALIYKALDRMFQADEVADKQKTMEDVINEQMAERMRQTINVHDQKIGGFDQGAMGINSTGGMFGQDSTHMVEAMDAIKKYGAKREQPEKERSSSIRDALRLNTFFK